MSHNFAHHKYSLTRTFAKKKKVQNKVRDLYRHLHIEYERKRMAEVIKFYYAALLWAV